MANDLGTLDELGPGYAESARILRERGFVRCEPSAALLEQLGPPRLAHGGRAVTCVRAPLDDGSVELCVYEWRTSARSVAYSRRAMIALVHHRSIDGPALITPSPWFFHPAITLLFAVAVVAGFPILVPLLLAARWSAGGLARNARRRTGHARFDRWYITRASTHEIAAHAVRAALREYLAEHRVEVTIELRPGALELRQRRAGMYASRLPALLSLISAVGRAAIAPSVSPMR